MIKERKEKRSVKCIWCSEEFKCVMNKGVVIWNIIPLHWWNYKDGESSQIMLIVFYHERCPCWGCGARRKGRPWMNSDSTVRGLGVLHGPAFMRFPVLEDAKSQKKKDVLLLPLPPWGFLCTKLKCKNEKKTSRPQQNALWKKLLKQHSFFFLNYN